MFKISSEIPLASTSPVRYQGIAYDGCHFFLSKQGDAQVVRLDNCFQVVECFTVHRCYHCLCYDPIRCCFWASSDKCPGVLFKLDRCFREIDRFVLRESEPCSCIGVITNISYVCWKDALLLTTLSGLVWVSVTEDGKAAVICRQQPESCDSTADDARCVCVSGVGGNDAWIHLNFEDGVSAQAHLETEDFCIDSAVFGCCVNCQRECCLYLLARKHGCYPYLLICVPDHHFCGCCCPCPCPPHPPCPHPPCPHPPCPHPPCPCPPCPKPPFPPLKPCEDLLESIALMEAALSHILNAEGEKLQKAIAESEDLEVLLKINETVRKTLIEATHLEQVLYHKLELAHEMCDSCKCEKSECDT